MTRHACDDEESHHEDLDEGDHVHEDHDDSSALLSGHAFPFPLYNLFVFRVFFGLYVVAASSLAALYDLVLVSAVSPFCRSIDVNGMFICSSVKFFNVGLRVSLFVHAHLVQLVLEVALHDRSVIVLLCGMPSNLWLS